MTEGIDPRRRAAIAMYSKRLAEDTFCLMVSETIPLVVPIFITVEYHIENFEPFHETYIISVSDMYESQLKVFILAICDKTILTGKGFHTIPIRAIREWRLWTPEDAPLSVNYHYLSEEYKALSFQ
jgi:hypothetical protein